MEANILSLLSDSPVTLYSLQKASGLSQTALTMALIGLGGRVAVQDGGLVLAPEPTPVAKVPAGPRGPTAKVQPRLVACQAAFMELCNRPEGVTAKALLEASNGTFLYTDILLVARNLLASGMVGRQPGILSRLSEDCTGSGGSGPRAFVQGASPRGIVFLLVGNTNGQPTSQGANHGSHQLRIHLAHEPR